MSFDGKLEMERGSAPTEPDIRKTIDEQLMYLVGSMRGHFSVPKGDQEITNISQRRVEASGDPGEWTGKTRYQVTYHYRGTILAREDLRARFFQPLLPLNPDAVYHAGRVWGRWWFQYPCTDPEYWTRGDFFYFWNPSRPNCPLKENRDYYALTPTVEFIDNPKTTYPEYERLVDDTGTISIWLLMGRMSPFASGNPLVSKDSNAPGFRAIREHLLQAGFKARRWKTAEIWGATQQIFSRPYVEDFTLEGSRAKVVVHAFFGKSNLMQYSRPFHFFLKDAIENASMLIYAGHAGLGEFLDLGRVERREGFRIHFNRDRYQIFFLNGCSTYSYYNARFFQQKVSPADPKGTKNLDIITNGMATGEDTFSRSTGVVLDSVIDWASGKGRASYQEIVRKADIPSLLCVNGDEDNPTE